MAQEELYKVDLIRERTGLGYEEARQLLSEVNGDVVQALILWERRGGRHEGRAARPPRPEEWVERARDLVRQGNETKFRVEKGERVFLDVPVTVGVLGAVLSPWVALLGVGAALATGCAVRVEPPRGRRGQAAPADGTTGGM